MNKLTEQELHDFAKRYNLILLSIYDEYINVDTPLSWKCGLCGFEFTQTISNIKKAQIPCEQCRKNPDIRFNYEEIKQQLTTGIPHVVSNNAWSIMKKILWEEIDQFMSYNRNIFFEKEFIYDIVLFRVFSFLKKKWGLINHLSKVRKKTITRSIQTIFLLRKDASLAQFEIVDIVGYSSSRPVKEIREFLGIPLPQYGARRRFDDEARQLRQCRICGNVKNYYRFRGRPDGEGRYYLRWECKKCENKNRALRRFEKKLLAIIFLTLKWNRGITPNQFLNYIQHGCKFNASDFKCFDCGLEVVDWLPSFQFDHVQPQLRTISWSELSYKNLVEIIFTLDREVCEPVCGNCHELRESYVFTQYKKDIFNDINSATIYADYRAVENYIKKKNILKEFTNGACPRCGISINLLPIFQTHHPDPSIREFSWADLRWKEIDEIRVIIIRERIKWLCCNCHEYIKNKYFSKYKTDILKKYLIFD